MRSRARLENGANMVQNRLRKWISRLNPVSAVQRTIVRRRAGKLIDQYASSWEHFTENLRSQSSRKMNRALDYAEHNQRSLERLIPTRKQQERALSDVQGAIREMDALTMALIGRIATLDKGTTVLPRDIRYAHHIKNDILSGPYYRLKNAEKNILQMLKGKPK